MSNCPGIQISQLTTMTFVDEGDYIVINDNNAITKRVSFTDFVGSLNANPNVRLTTYAKDVFLVSPGGEANPLWGTIAPNQPFPVNQEQGNNYILTELVRHKEDIENLNLRLTQVEGLNGGYATKEYVDQQILLEKTAREGADDVLMNIKADKYNHYTKDEIDQLLDDIVVGDGNVPEAPSDGTVYGRPVSYTHLTLPTMCVV